jgi:hypothetical protein
MMDNATSGLRIFAWVYNSTRASLPIVIYSTPHKRSQVEATVRASAGNGSR